MASLLVVITVQPGFGYEGDPMRLLFEQGLAPTHAFSAFYRHLREDFGAHAVLHFGTHGALEFMPGKQSGLSGDCWPDRLIGMIQPAGIVTPATPSDTDSPNLAEVGCAGRITGFQETEDGRYLIALTGITRFRVREEIKHDGAYRIVRADWEAFASDLDRQPALDESARARLIAALQSYLERGAMKADWTAVEEAPVDTLINSLSAGCPFTNPEKQALLEARTLEDRCAALISLLQMERPGQGGGYVQ